MQNMIMVVIKNVKLAIECTKTPNALKIPFLLQIQEVYHHQLYAEITKENIVSFSWTCIIICSIVKEKCVLKLFCLKLLLVYVDSASSCNDLLFVLNSRITAKRSWNIRIIQYHCNHGNLAPKGCTEYYFDTKGTGTVSSYNWNNGNGNHLANQNQLICIRRESGFCRICYITEDARDISISGGR